MNIQELATFAKVSIAQAEKIHEVLLSEGLIDFSQATTSEYRKAILLAAWFIYNGRSWE